MNSIDRIEPGTVIRHHGRAFLIVRVSEDGEHASGSLVIRYGKEGERVSGSRYYVLTTGCPVIEQRPELLKGV